MGIGSLFSEAFVSIKAEEGFKYVIRGIVDERTGLTPGHLDVMATGRISLKSLLTPEQLRKMQERKDTPEIKYLAKRELASPGYLLGLLTETAPKHGAVLKRYPEYASLLVSDLKSILGI